jgi:hypothetical protein
MPTGADPLLVGTGVAVALVVADHAGHATVTSASISFASVCTTTVSGPVQ